jgi:endonuclease YncB( thermonuclease family)
MAKLSKRRTTEKRLAGVAIVIVVAVLILVIRLVEEIGPERQSLDRFSVKRVLDGDTVELLGGDRLRLLAIDTPERGQPLYNDAVHFLDSVSIGRTAEIKFVNRRRDHYGRLLGYLYIDSLFINKVILENGLAYLYLFKDNDLDSPEIQELLAAQRSAIAKGVGLWSIQRTPEEFYLAGQRSFRFHRPGCRSVRDLKPGTYRKFATRDEAPFIGLSPCRNCQP